MQEHRVAGTFVLLDEHTIEEQRDCAPRFGYNYKYLLFSSRSTIGSTAMTTQVPAVDKSEVSRLTERDLFALVWASDLPFYDASGRPRGGGGGFAGYKGSVSQKARMVEHRVATVLRTICPLCSAMTCVLIMLCAFAATGGASGRAAGILTGCWTIKAQDASAGCWRLLPGWGQ